MTELLSIDCSVSIEIHLILLVQATVSMDESMGIQLLTLWFVLLIFLQTLPGGSNFFMSVLGLVATLLVFALPFVIITIFTRQFTEG